MGQANPINRTGHLYVREHHADYLSLLFENCDRLISITCLNDRKPGIFQRHGRGHASKNFVFDDQDAQFAGFGRRRHA